MPLPHPAALPALPGTVSLVLRILVYAGGMLLSGFGGYHGYRRISGGRFTREQVEAERLRDELVFGDEDARALGVPEDPNPFELPDDPDTRAKP